VSDAVAGASAPAPRSVAVHPLTVTRNVYRGALIGFGGVARNSHLPGARLDPGLRDRLEIVVAVDPATSAQDEADIPVIGDRAALHTFAPIDFVDVCTPTGLHLATTLWALDEGLHVLCEKPVATTRAEASAIAAAARRTKRIVMPCHQHRFNPAWQQMQRWLHDGVIGHWHLAELSVYRGAADAGRGDAVRPWRTVAAEGAGGILLDHGTHLL
jgi:predicted dehydrogenase